MDSITLPLVIAALVFTGTNLVAYVRARNWDAVAKIAVAWALSVGALWLAGQTRWAEGTTFDGVLLKSLSVADLIVMGLLVSGVAGAGSKLLAALDSTRTSASPALLPNLRGEPSSAVHQGDSLPTAAVGASLMSTAALFVVRLAVIAVCVGILVVLFVV